METFRGQSWRLSGAKVEDFSGQKLETFGAPKSLQLRPVSCTSYPLEVYEFGPEAHSSWRLSGAQKSPTKACFVHVLPPRSVRIWPRSPPSWRLSGPKSLQLRPVSCTSYPFEVYEFGPEAHTGWRLSGPKSLQPRPVSCTLARLSEQLIFVCFVCFVVSLFFLFFFVVRRSFFFVC